MKKVLIVDDEIMVRIGIRSILNWEEYGYTIIGEASNGREALAKIEAEFPDLIFTDLLMPQIDGFELMEHCRTNFPHIKFIVMSNYDEFDKARTALQLGAIDYIFKLKISEQELVETLSRANNYFDKKVDLSNYSVYEKNVGAIKNKLITVACDGSFSSSKEIIADLKSVCPNLDFERKYAILGLTIFDDHESQIDTNTEVFNFALENMITEVFIEAVPCCEIFRGKENVFFVVVHLDVDCDDYNYQFYCEERFNTLNVLVKRYFNVFFVAGFSHVVRGFSQLSPTMKNIYRILKYRAFVGDNLFFLCDDIKNSYISEVQAYIYKNIAGQHTLETLANVVHLSPSYLSYIFKQETNTSLTDYINTVRIHKACVLLTNTGLKINEIANKVGIDNVNYFSVLFKKVMNDTPNSYRRKS